MSISFVRSPGVSNTTFGTGTTTSLAGNIFSVLPTIGNKILVLTYVNIFGSGTTISVTDNAPTPNTYTQIGFVNYAGNSFATSDLLAIHEATVTSIPSGSFHVTVNLGSAANVATAQAEFSGVGAIHSGQINGNYSTANVVTSTPSVSLSVSAGDLAIALLAIDDSDSSESITLPSGWTDLGNIPGAPPLNSDYAFRIVSSSGTITPTWTLGASKFTAVLGMVFQGSAPAPTYYPASIYFIM